MALREEVELVPSLDLRPATPADLSACASIWRHSINDYTARLNQPDIPDDLTAVLRLYGHLQSGDPDGFLVAERSGPGGERRIVAFVSAIRRAGLWFLSMLFVLPEAQGSGVGRTLLRRVMPGGGTLALATCTDSLQPISNALYASLGIVPRMPLFRLVGLPDRLAELPPLPAAVRAVGFDEAVDRSADRLGSAALDDAIAALDRATLGVEHPADHAFIREEGRIGFLYVGPDGHPVGYAYASPAGRVGPVAVLDPSLQPAVLGHVLANVPPRGAFGIWAPGLSPAMQPLLAAGFRIDGFPVLVCWDRPFAAFDRYVPISPGLL